MKAIKFHFTCATYNKPAIDLCHTITWILNERERERYEEKFPYVTPSVLVGQAFVCNPYFCMCESLDVMYNAVCEHCTFRGHKQLTINGKK